MRKKSRQKRRNKKAIMDSLTFVDHELEQYFQQVKKNKKPEE